MNNDKNTIDDVLIEISEHASASGITPEELLNIVATKVVNGAGWAPLVSVFSQIGKTASAIEFSGGQKSEASAIRLGVNILTPFLTRGMVKIGKRGRSLIISEYDSVLDNFIKERSKKVAWNTSEPRLWNGIVSRKDRIPLIASASRSALSANKTEPILSVLNKLGSVPYRIDKRVYELIRHHHSVGDGPMRFFREKDLEKRIALSYALSGLFSAVERVGFDDDIYFRWNYDFRGRVYPSDPFLNPHGQDHVRALLRFGRKRKLGKTGLTWLAIHTANAWGYDKLSLSERVEKVFNNLDYIREVAQNPIENTSWWTADKPYMFYAACCEMDAFLKHEGNEEDFESDLICYIDGAQNGVQHLCALTRDEEIGALVGLVPQDAPGDLYSHIADIVWERMEAEYENLGIKGVLQEVLEKEEYYRAAASEKGALIKSEEASEFFSPKNKKRLAAAYEYWLSVTSPSIRRKAVKRPVMTLGYGATKYGMGNMVHQDLDDINEYIDRRTPFFSSVLGGIIYKTCYEQLGRVGSALTALKDVAKSFGKTHMEWCAPFDEFFVKTRYNTRKSAIFQAKIENVVLRLRYQYYDRTSVAVRSQVQAAPPNIIHSLDAAHLREAVRRMNHDVTVIHDSFGSHPGTMSSTLAIVSRTFVDMYQDMDINSLARMINPEVTSLVETGSLDITKVMDSDYFFH